MRIVAWNCRDGWERKAGFVSELAPDIAIVSEVRKQAFESVAVGHTDRIWTGADGAKGLAIFGWNGWRFQPTYDAPERHMLAVSAELEYERLTLVGVWAMPQKGDYVAPIARGLSELKPHLKDDVIIAGDFNAHPRWDTGKSESRQFASIVSGLASLGIRSVWHSHAKEHHGHESAPTYYHSDKQPFHIDYIFASERLLQKVTSMMIGTHQDWIENRRSDHTPLVVDLSDTANRTSD